MGGAAGGLLGTAAGHVTGKALNKYPGQSREYGGKAGTMTGAALGAYAASKGKNKVLNLMGEADKLHGVHKRLGKMLPLAKAFLPELAAGALGAAIFARSRGSHKEKEAVSKAWELENKPGRSTVTKQVSMIDSHRGQIAASETGSVGSVLSRHKKVKQSIGDSMKLAGFLSGVREGITSPLSSIGHGLADALTIHKSNYYREPHISSIAHEQLGRAVGGATAIGGVGAGGYALGKHHEKDKKAMTAMQPPEDPQIQQKWRGRPAKMKDTTTVAGAMQDTNSMLAPASTTAGPTQ